MNTTTTLRQRLMLAIYPAVLTAMLLALGAIGAVGGTAAPKATLQSSAPQAEVTLYGLATVAAADAAA